METQQKQIAALQEQLLQAQEQNQRLQEKVSALEQQKLHRHEGLAEASEERKEGAPASFSARSLQGPSGLPRQKRANEGGQQEEEEEEKSQELFSREQGKILVLTLTI